MDIDDERSSGFQLIAYHHEDLSLLYASIADLDRGSRSETPETSERPIELTDLAACAAAGKSAKDSCVSAGGAVNSCTAVGKIAEAACLKNILDTHEIKAPV